MDKRTSDDVGAGLAKLSKAVDDGDIVIFTPSEAEAMRELAKFWNQIKSVVELGGTIGGFMKWVVVLAGSYMAIKAGFFDWVREGIQR